VYTLSSSSVRSFGQCSVGADHWYGHNRGWPDLFSYQRRYRDDDDDHDHENSITDDDDDDDDDNDDNRDNYDIDEEVMRDVPYDHVMHRLTPWRHHSTLKSP